MDPRLLRLYTDELHHLREMGREFAQAFPLVGTRLGMEAMPVADPYVERLLEGFAYLAARVQLKIEAEQPRLVAHLLEALYPNFLAPVPSMMVVQLGVDTGDPNLARGPLFPRGRLLRSLLARGQDTHCEFRTAHDVRLWPVEIASVASFTHAPDLPLGRIADARAARGGLRIRLRTGGGVPFSALGLDRLVFYISAPDDVAFRLHELILGQAIGTLAGAGRAAMPWQGAHSVQPVGFGDDEALLPETLRTFSGHRLIQEVAAMPQRLLFFEIGALGARLAAVEACEAEIVVLFGRGDPGLEPLVDRDSLALHCTPAINLFPKRLDPIQVGPGSFEHHAVVDRTRPVDHEVHSVLGVTGHGTGAEGPQTFLPLYATEPGGRADAAGYYTVRREPRLPSAARRKQGARSSYIGEELYLAIVDPRHAPYRADLRQLSVLALVTHRDLPTLLPQGSLESRSEPPQWEARSPGPVVRVDALRGPTRPVPRRPVGDTGWQLVNHLAVNHRALAGAPPEQAAAVLRDTLALYGPPEDGAFRRQLEGIRGLQASTVVRRLPVDGPLCFGTGIEFVLTLDELAFQGGSAFLFASLIEVFLARHAAINTFTQLRLVTPQRGERMRWPPRSGGRPLV